MRCASAWTIEKQDVERKRLASVTVLTGGPDYPQDRSRQLTRRESHSDMTRYRKLEYRCQFMRSSDG